MKHSLSLLILLLAVTSVMAQEEAPVIDKKRHKIVIHLTSGDTLVHKAVIKQIGNILEAAPNSKVEVVCHNNGISMLVTAQTKQAAKVADFKNRGVTFLACENTMRERKIKREELLPQSGTVPSGLMEIVKKQEKGWAYLRAGL